MPSAEKDSPDPWMTGLPTERSSGAGYDGQDDVPSAEKGARANLAQIVLNAMLDSGEQPNSGRMAFAVADSLLAEGCVLPPANGGGHHPRCTGQHETVMGETACVLPPERTCLCGSGEVPGRGGCSECR